MLLDSSIIIYASMPEHAGLRALIARQAPAISAISYIEVMGYPRLTAAERICFKQFFNAARIVPIDEDIVDTAIQLRQQRKMSLGDSVIAATALERGLRLVTRNTRNFDWIPALSLLNPVDKSRDAPGRE